MVYSYVKVTNIVDINTEKTMFISKVTNIVYINTEKAMFISKGNQHLLHLLNFLNLYNIP